MTTPRAALISLLREHPGITEADLLEKLRARWPRATIAELAHLLGSLGADVERVGHRLKLRVASDYPQGTDNGPVRAIAFDLEAVVRPSAKPPYVRRAVFQIGGVRFGDDEDWIRRQPSFTAWCALPEGFELDDPARRATHGTHARPLADALQHFAAFCTDADTLVAYNGTELDFPLLDQCAASEGVDLPRMRRVDALYLAHCLWPHPLGSHRLAELAVEVGAIETTEGWHDAEVDSRTLVALLTAGQKLIDGWPSSLRNTMQHVVAGSSAWRLILRTPLPTTSIDDADVRAMLAGILTSPSAASRLNDRATSPDRWHDEAGRVDPARIAAAAGRREGLTRRPAQDEMMSRVRDAIDGQRDLVIEAPTGTGKTAVAFAAAMDWLDASPQHRVVISTGTKALQAQLARDVESLSDDSFDALLGAFDVVKGKMNRLSLRALTHAVVDCARRAPGFASRELFREFVAYLLLRRVSHHKTLLHRVEAVSVDPEDVPAFFGTYLRGSLRDYSAVLSQGHSGDFADGEELSEHTKSVRTALATRIVVANHSLVVAHLDDFSGTSQDTLLIIDEAHAFEAALTQALTPRFSYQNLENTVFALARWNRAQGGATGVDDAIEALEFILDTERIPNAALAALDRLAGPISGTHGRAATLSSPYSGDAGSQPAQALLIHLSQAVKQLRSVRFLLRTWHNRHRQKLDRNQLARAHELRVRVETLESAGISIVGEAGKLFDYAFLGPPTDSDSEPTAGDDDGPDLFGSETDADDDAASEDTAETCVESPTSAYCGETTLNRVLALVESDVETLAHGMRRYHFEIMSSPIRVTREAEWAHYTECFASKVYTSATLRVADSWSYFQDRLDLRETTVHAVSSAFNYRQQARLFVLSDFPSWTEQPEAATHTLATQVSGLLSETERATPEAGAVILATSRGAAAGIADTLAQRLAARPSGTKTWAAPILGNRRAVRMYERQGGILVGTKGLWTGVDIANPDRTRLLWINKLPFAPFGDPLIAARRAEIAAHAEAAGARDGDAQANEKYYIPLAAIELRQAVGRLIRSDQHRGVIVISDRRLAGRSRLRRSCRDAFLGSLDAGLLVDNPTLGGAGAGCVMTMEEAWSQIWSFLSAGGDIVPTRAEQLRQPDALAVQVWPEETRRIRALALSPDEVTALGANLEAVVVNRAAEVGALLRFDDHPLTLREEQRRTIAAAARGEDVMALLPTGFGKSFCFQLPALVLPGITVVVSPLVALMVDQAMELNRTIGGAVRAIVGPLRESASREGKQAVAEQLRGTANHGIRLIYVSPERFAHRQFADWVRDAARARRLSRIVLDEAHTLIQWGDDFRPAFGRLANLLAELRQAVPVSAFTATASRTVREGLLSRVFARTSEGSRRDNPRQLCTVQASPIRPELAIFRRQLGRGGRMSTARLVEAVFDRLGGHSIFYCLTVREVNTLWAHLRDYAGTTDAPRVLRFHGRLSEGEKAATLAAFRDAPREGDIDYRPCVVVATSAFGLGINRDDVRCVFSVSPPTDLAALYQQLGRAGRDRRGEPPGPADPVSAGLALATPDGYRTVEFFAGRDLDQRVLRAAGKRVLGAHGWIDAGQIARELVRREVAAGRLSTQDAQKAATEDHFRTGVLRALVALSAAGAVEDRGDFPATVSIAVGEETAETDVADAVLKVLSTVDDASRVDVVTFHDSLLSDLGNDPAATWSLLIDLHHEGVLDVSQQPNRTWLTSVAPRTTELPEDFEERVGHRTARSISELASLRAWFADGSTCANVGLAEYFAAGTLPPGACSRPGCRCSSCWGRADLLSPDDTLPPLLDALLHPPRRPASAISERRRRRLDAAVAQLLADNPLGLGLTKIWATLRGSDSYWSAKQGCRQPLRPRLLHHRLFGAMPAVQKAGVLDAIDRLVRARRLEKDPEMAFWRPRRKPGTASAPRTPA